jgi:hypothetical protein
MDRPRVERSGKVKAGQRVALPAIERHPLSRSWPTRVMLRLQQEGRAARAIGPEAKADRDQGLGHRVRETARRTPCSCCI